MINQRIHRQAKEDFYISYERSCLRKVKRQVLAMTGPITNKQPNIILEEEDLQ